MVLMDKGNIQTQVPENEVELFKKEGWVVYAPKKKNLSNKADENKNNKADENKNNKADENESEKN